MLLPGSGPGNTNTRRSLARASSLKQRSLVPRREVIACVALVASMRVSSIWSMLFSSSSATWLSVLSRKTSVPSSRFRNTLSSRTTKVAVLRPGCESMRESKLVTGPSISGTNAPLPGSSSTRMRVKAAATVSLRCCQWPCASRHIVVRMRASQNLSISCVTSISSMRARSSSLASASPNQTRNFAVLMVAQVFGTLNVSPGSATSSRLSSAVLASATCQNQVGSA